jgi:hypothetical protein
VKQLCFKMLGAPDPATVAGEQPMTTTEFLPLVRRVKRVETICLAQLSVGHNVAQSSNAF